MAGVNHALRQGDPTVQTISELVPLRRAVSALKRTGTLALVPTMGALHDGHLALVRAAKQHADHVAVSVFVNPRQFGANEDLDAYPRQPARDAALLQAEGVSLLWAPTAAAMYPAGYATTITIPGISQGLCGAVRPGHFDGVATVVCKLFNQVQPDCALFGEKDWQQLAVIRAMARDLDLTLPQAGAIIGVPTVRAADGLALSSRNAYLTAQQRVQAAALPRAMRWLIENALKGQPLDAALLELEENLLAEGFDRIDYAQICAAQTLEPLMALSSEPARLLVAARIGATRLIDNMAVR